MAVIGLQTCEGVGEDGECLVERHAMLGEIGCRFAGIPFEGERHASSVLDARCIRLPLIRQRHYRTYSDKRDLNKSYLSHTATRPDSANPLAQRAFASWRSTGFSHIMRHGNVA